MLITETLQFDKKIDRNVADKDQAYQELHFMVHVKLLTVINTCTFFCVAGNQSISS